MINVILWSPLTRIIHWAIALPVLLNFFLEGGDSIHKVLGYIALAGLVVRIIWGLVSQDKAHVKFFLIKTSDIKDHLLSMAQNKVKDYPGHNPLASVTYIIIWILVGLLGISGYMRGLDAFWGEEWLENLHESFSNILVVLVFCHLAGIIWDGIKYKRKTWKGMITGKRQ